MHKPVLLNEVIEYLDPKANENFIDCTLGEAGHASAILEKIKPDGKVLGIDTDFESLKRIGARENLIVVYGNFGNLKKIIEENNFKNIKGILFDLGLSIWQLEESGRGFSFKKDEPLKMILSKDQEVSAEEIINTWPEESLIEMIRNYGEERFARRIVQRIVQKRKLAPIKTTFRLLEAIKRGMPFSITRRGGTERVAARVFQALRIVVNDEMENLKKGLEQAAEILDAGGRIVVISFHSLEDRIVKRFFIEQETNGSLKILTSKPITASEAEIKFNSCSRSSKLRAAMKGADSHPTTQ